MQVVVVVVEARKNVHFPRNVLNRFAKNDPNLTTMVLSSIRRDIVI